MEQAQGVMVDEVTEPVRTPAQTVLREGTDTLLFAQVIGQGRTTRAELAEATGISKPTVSEAVRRLVAGGLLDATGPKETGRRGRVGTFYELGSAAGWVLAIEVDQSGVKSWSADLAGRVRARHAQPPGAAGDTAALAAALRKVAKQAVESAASGFEPNDEPHDRQVPGPDNRPGPLRAVAVSVANPVHPSTHEVIALPGSPFPEGLLSPADVLAGVLSAPVLVDNDVNLAALAEHRAGTAGGVDSFAYVYVGAGLGLGLYVGDRLIRGAHGLAGEIGYLPGSDLTAAPGLQTLAAELAAAGLGRSDAPSNDVEAVLRLLDSLPAEGERVLEVLSRAVARAIASVQAVIDPELVVLGGPVGSHPVLLEPVRQKLATISIAPGRLEHGTLGVLAPLNGAVYLALDHARAAAISQLTPVPRS